MPSVQRAHEVLKTTDAVVWLISLDGGGKKAVQNYLTQEQVTVPVLLDPRMEVARKFGARGIPTTLIIDRTGAVVARGTEPLDFDGPAFLQYIEALLAQPRS